MDNRNPFPDDLKTLKIVEPRKSKLFEVTDGQRSWFVKNLNPREARMTLMASEADLGPDAITHIAKAKPIDSSDFSEELQKRIYDGYGCQMFLIEAVPNQHGFYQLTDHAHPDDKAQAFNEGLRGIPITVAEQDKIIAEWEHLNATGVNHRDLGSNTGFQRRPDGTLEMGVWDFDDDEDNDRDDLENIRSAFEELQEAGTAESRTKWTKPELKKPDAEAGQQARKNRTRETPD